MNLQLCHNIQEHNDWHAVVAISSYRLRNILHSLLVIFMYLPIQQPLRVFCTEIDVTIGGIGILELRNSSVSTIQLFGQALFPMVSTTG